MGTSGAELLAACSNCYNTLAKLQTSPLRSFSWILFWVLSNCMARSRTRTWRDATSRKQYNHRS